MGHCSRRKILPGDLKEKRIMKAFQLIPAIAEYEDFSTYAKEAQLGGNDLILTNEYI